MSQSPKRKACQCADPGCPVHKGESQCPRSREMTWRLFRVDQIDRTGTLFCAACGDDAWDSGLFRGRR